MPMLSVGPIKRAQPPQTANTRLPVRDKLTFIIDDVIVCYRRQAPLDARSVSIGCPLVVGAQIERP
jgi:hypothetical protein